ncbi:MAG: LAGLIDADG family homing endonuclease [Candidatus Woesearchaeota archaeon]
MAITEHDRYALRKIVKELELYKGRHTELVSVYIPQGYDMNKVVNQLAEEQGTASNIKSTSTRKNVTDALERMIQHLKRFKFTPPNGLAVFSGNVAEREGQQDLKVWSVEPPIPLKIRLYRCDKEFVTDILSDMLDIKEVYGLVVMDRREGVIATLKGKTITPLAKYTSNVPGKTKAGGQCCAASTLIMAANGEILKIGESHNPYMVKSADFDRGTVVDSPITDKWNVEKSSAYKIITACPRLEIETSKDHVFFISTKDGISEKPAGQLKQGDFLVMPEKIKVSGSPQKISSKKYYSSFIISESGRQLLKEKRQKKGLSQKQLAQQLGDCQTAISHYELGKRNAERKPLQKLCSLLGLDFELFLKEHTKPHHYFNVEAKLPEKITPEFAQFLGYVLGDGSIETDRITLFEQDKQVALSYKNSFDTYFNIKSSYKLREDKNYHQLKFTSRPLVRLIQNEFSEIKRGLNSRIPQKVLLSEDDVVAGFLHGLFDAEGYVSSRGLGLGMNNRMLIQQVQMALLRFGILASFYEYDNRRNPYSINFRYTLSISEKESLLLFKKLINFTSSKKLEKLAQIAEMTSDKSSVRQIMAPGSAVRRIVEKAGYLHKIFPKVSNFFRDKRMMSKAVFMSSIMNQVQDAEMLVRLERIYNYGLLPVKVAEIEVINKETPMVDISVKNQNFVANGLLVHNSAQRFMRLREGAAKEFFTRLGDHIKDEFFGKKDLKGIIIGGPGPTKHEFIDGSFIPTELKNKIIAVKDITYTDEFGLNELVERSEDILAEEEIIGEKKVMAEFFNYLATKMNKVAYGEKEVRKALELGAVDRLLLSESIPEEKMEEFEAEAKKTGAAVIIISTETREGGQLRELGGIAAILRYELQTE